MINTNHSISTEVYLQRALRLDRLPLTLLGKIATYLPESDFSHLSATHRTWRASNSREMWLTAIQQDFPIASKPLRSALQGYPEAIKTGRLYALIYKGLRITGGYPLQTTFTHPHPQPMCSVAFDPTGHLIILAAGDGTAHVYARKPDGGWGLTHSLKGHKKQWVLSVAFDPLEGNRIVTTSIDRTACVYVRKSNEWVLEDTLTGHQGWVRHAAFNPKGSHLITTSQDSTARVYAWQSGKRWVLTDILTDHNGPVLGAAFDPMSHRIVTASSDGSARVYTQQSGKRWILTNILTGPNDWVFSAAFDPMGSRIVTASGDGVVRVYTQQPDGSWVLTHTLTGHKGQVFKATFDPTGDRIITASSDGTARVYTQQFDGRWVLTDSLKGHNSRLLSAAYDPTSGCIVTASGDRTVRIWGLNPHKIIRRALTGIEIQNAGIRTSYQAISTDVVRYMAGFLTQPEQQAHRLVNKASALLWSGVAARRGQRAVLASL